MTKEIRKLEKMLEAKTGKVIISNTLIKPKTRIDYKKAAKIADEIRELEYKELRKLGLGHDCPR